MPSHKSWSSAAAAIRRKLYLFTKPAVPGRVKTRLIGELSAEQTAMLHDAFLADVCEQLVACDETLELNIAWALDPGEAVPRGVGGHRIVGLRQTGEDLGQRLFNMLSEGAGDGAHVAALGSDHPEISALTVDEAFAKLDQGADVVIGPTVDGGYFLIAVAARALRPRIFEDISWSTDAVCRQTLSRCRELGLTVEQLAEGHDVDVPADLEELIDRLEQRGDGCRSTRELLNSWGKLDKTPGKGDA